LRRATLMIAAAAADGGQGWRQGDHLLRLPQMLDARKDIDAVAQRPR
jgi:hypothetical protein